MNARKKLLIANSFLVLLLNACTTLGPDFRTPDVKVPESWLEIDGNLIKAEQAEYRQWWKSFNDPVLDSLIQKAYAQNLTLRLAGVRIFEARATLGIAIGNWYPQLQSGTGSINYNRQSEHAGGASASGGQGRDLTSAQSQLGVGATWELDFWGKFQRSIESADASMMSFVAAYDQALVSLLGDVASTYVQIRVLEERLRIAQENFKTQNESLNIADARFQAGATGARDVEQAKSQLYSTEATIPELERRLEIQRNALSILLGIAPAELGDLLSGKPGIPSAPLQVAVSIPADLIRRRPDIRQAEYIAAAQSALIGATEADFYPSFSLSGSFGFSAVDQGGSNLGDMFTWGARTASAGPSFRWNLLNYGQISNAVRVQDARFEEALVAYQQAVLFAQQEVQNSIVSFTKAIHQVSHLEKAVAAAKRALGLIMEEYQNGAADYTTVLTAEQAVLAQEDALMQSRGAVPLALVSIYKALGGGWQLREGNEFIPLETKSRMSERINWGDLLNTLPREEGEESKTSVPSSPDW